MPIGCHFRDCKSVTGHETDSGKKRYSKYLTFTFYLFTIPLLRVPRRVRFGEQFINENFKKKSERHAYSIILSPRNSFEQDKKAAFRS